MAFTVHFEFQGQMLGFVLDLVEVPESHSGKNMAKYFLAVLHKYGISKKVFISFLLSKVKMLTIYVGTRHYG